MGLASADPLRALIPISFTMIAPTRHPMQFAFSYESPTQALQMSGAISPMTGLHPRCLPEGEVCRRTRIAARSGEAREILERLEAESRQQDV